MPYRIVSVVEGQGDVVAVPVLLRRFINQINPPVAIDIARPIRQPRGTLLKPGGIEAAVQFAATAMGDKGAVLVLLDSDGDCPKSNAPVLAERARNARNDKRVAVVMAHQEYEAWFLASASSLARVRRLRADIVDHADPESVRGCKEWLEQWLPSGFTYSERADQAALTAEFDMTLAKSKAPSFDKLWREVESIFQHAVTTEES